MPSQPRPLPGSSASLKKLLLLVVTAGPALSACAKPAEPQVETKIARPPPVFHGNASESALIFDGDSIWGSEVDSLATNLASHQISYEEVDSSQLNAMTLDQLTAYSLLIVPGGYAPTVTASLSKQTHEMLREAVQLRGLSYLGFCAGAWLAVAPAPSPGEDVTYGVGLVDGPLLRETPMGKQGFEFKIVKAQFPDGSKRDLLWYGGPITPDAPGGVIVKYPDGAPAITQMRSGQGFVTLSGLHPTATTAILDALGLSDPQAVAPDLAWKLLDSSMRQSPLPAF